MKNIFVMLSKGNDYRDLITSPIFNLSMASKELFHSNMLYWISNTYPQIFKDIMKDLIPNIGQWKDWKSYREKEHLDLSIEGREKTILLIIENKVKSIPYKEQLDNYSITFKYPDKSKKLLLSLSESIPQKQEIENNWTVRNYLDLSTAIKKNLRMCNIYHRLILTDYCRVIESLHKLQSNWIYNPKGSYIKQFVQNDNFILETKLRIQDLRIKNLYSQFAKKIQEDLSNSGITLHFATNKEILNDITNNKQMIGKKYINWGFTNNQGIIDLKIRVTNTIFLGIQIQGNSYKHCIEVFEKKNKSDISKLVNDYIKGIQNKNSTYIINCVFCQNFLCKDQHSLNISNVCNYYPIIKENIIIPKYQAASLFNKYNTSFVYQYINISSAETIDTIVDAIEKDIEKIDRIIFCINQHQPNLSQKHM